MKVAMYLLKKVRENELHNVAMETSKHCSHGPDLNDPMKLMHEPSSMLDYQGQPAIKATTGGWTAACLILCMEMCERLATLGIGLNLVTYFHNDMHLSIPKSANMVTNFLGASYLTCLLGGFLADTYLGRYATIAAGSCIQLLGIVLITLSSSLRGFRPPPCNVSAITECEPANSCQLLFLYSALALIALGTGGIKSSVSGLGADQFDETDPRERVQMQSYFNWFCFGISTGAILAVTVLVYLQDNQGRNVGYGVCACCMVISMCLFMGGAKLYRFNPPEGSPLTQISQVFVAAWRNRHLRMPEDSRDLYHGENKLIHPLPQDDNYDVASSVYGNRKPMSQISKHLLFLNKAAIVLERPSAFTPYQSPWKLCSVKKVEEVKCFLSLFPILATTIVFWTATAQMATFSIEQGVTLDRRIWGGFQIPPASLSAFTQISILLTIPLYDLVLVPMARKCTGCVQGITTFQRIGIGLVFSIFAMITAAVVERKRLHKVHEIKGASSVLAMSIFELAPQYMLVGVGDTFTYIGQLDLFYTRSPHGMRSLGTGFCLSTISFGFLLSSALVSVVNKWTKHGSHQGWLANNLNQGRLDKFYGLLAICNFISLIMYVVYTTWYSRSHKDSDASKRCRNEITENEVDARTLQLTTNSRWAPEESALFVA